MARITFLDSPLWEQFQKAARKRRRNAVRLLTDYMREKTRRSTKRFGAKRVKAETEEDAVKLVRQHRLESKELKVVRN